MKLRNLLAHAFNFIDRPHGVRTAPAVPRVIDSEGEARASETLAADGEIDGVPIMKSDFSLPTGLPEPEPDVYLIVPEVVASAARSVGRSTADLLVPGEETGRNYRTTYYCSLRRVPR